MLSLKSKIREEVKNILKMMSASLAIVKSQQICERLQSLSIYTKAKDILFYYPLSDEVDIRYSINQAFKDKKNVYLPYITNKKQSTMKFSKIKNLADIERGIYGISEPKNKNNILFKNLDLLICPGLAFDLSLNRLGRGKGFYDHFLKNCSVEDPNNLQKRWAVALEVQIFDKIPVDNNDQKMTGIITENRIIN